MCLFLRAWWEQSGSYKGHGFVNGFVIGWFDACLSATGNALSQPLISQHDWRVYVDKLLMNVLFPAHGDSLFVLFFLFLILFTLKSSVLFFSAQTLHPSLSLSSCSCSLQEELVLHPPLPLPWDLRPFPLNMLVTSTWPCPMYLALPTMSRPSPHLTNLKLLISIQMCSRWPKEKSSYWARGRESSSLQRAWNRNHTLNRSIKDTVRLWWPLKTLQRQIESTSQRQPYQVEKYRWCVCFPSGTSSVLLGIVI